MKKDGLAVEAEGDLVQISQHPLYSFFTHSLASCRALERSEAVMRADNFDLSSAEALYPAVAAMLSHIYPNTSFWITPSPFA